MSTPRWQRRESQGSPDERVPTPIEARLFTDRLEAERHARDWLDNGWLAKLARITRKVPS